MPSGRSLTTYAIIDGSEVFIETPSDLQMQSSTWSQYKHHNTAKFLVGCTPNGAICYISSVFTLDPYQMWNLHAHVVSSLLLVINLNIYNGRQRFH